MGYSYSIRYNLYEKNENQSIGIGVTPYLGFDGGGFYKDDDPFGIGTFSIPITLSYNLGTGATYDTNKDRGFAIALGVDAYYTPLFTTSKYKEKFQKLRVSPHIKISFRFWGKSNALREIFISYNYIKNDNKVDIKNGTPPPMSVKFGFGKFLNY